MNRFVGRGGETMKHRGSLGPGWMKVFVVGGTGFVGSHVLPRLIAAKHEVWALARSPEALAPYQGDVRIIKGDITKPLTYRGRALGCTASINMVGLLRENRFRGETYRRIVVRGTEQWVQECREAGVKHLVLVSANGADPRGTKYQRTKWVAEQAVRNSGLSWTILRPSFLIGAGADFSHQMARLLKLRLVPVWGRQDYYFEPVAVDEAARVIVESLRHPKAKNRVFHLGGPDQLTYKEILQGIKRETHTACALLPAPKSLGYAMGAALGWIPGFPATLENLKMLFAGNVTPEHEWEAAFGLVPKGYEEQLRAAFGHRPPAPA